ncbi:hypothetical protein DMC01_11140 [Campylobacter troglodytis]|nr:hypothetical protein DMC01_11140 [Campylobacter troglodytis]
MSLNLALDKSLIKASLNIFLWVKVGERAKCFLRYLIYNFFKSIDLKVKKSNFFLIKIYKVDKNKSA